MLPNHKRKFTINNVSELDLLMMHNEEYSAEIASTVGAAKRIKILTRAKELNVDVTNKKKVKRIERLEAKEKNHKTRPVQ